MQKQLKNFQDQLNNSDFAASVLATPGPVKDTTDLTIILKDLPPASDNKKPQAQQNPVDRVAALLVAAELTAAELHFFPAAKSSAVMAVNVTSTAEPNATPSKEPKLTPDS